LDPFNLKSLFKQKKGIEKHIHKIEKIRNLLNTFNYLNFVLIGDSGQQDAEIYKNISIEFPERVIAIYIRDIKKSKAKKVNIIGKQLDPLGVEMLLIKDTLLAAKHAIDKGLINKNQLKNVASERDRDHFAEIEI
ncbi:MAG: App1 family protein, partial [Bacteroidetes bacterium]|nr:App1 family protein [Bacteroidota bacterium]